MIYNNLLYEIIREKRRVEEAKNRPEQLAKGEQREIDGDKRVAFIQALIASGGHPYFQARIAAATNPREVYLETCAELGVEPAGIDQP